MRIEMEINVNEHAISNYVLTIKNLRGASHLTISMFSALIDNDWICFMF